MSIELNVLRTYINSVADCKDVTTGSTGELMENKEFRRGLVRGAIEKRDGCSRLYIKNVTEVLRKQVAICGKDVLHSSKVLKMFLKRASFSLMINNFI